MSKLLTTIFSFIILSGILFAAVPPDTVQKSFDIKFPKVGDLKWEKENPKVWEASFTVDGAKQSANFNIKGDWLETEREINKAHLPEKVTETINKKFAKWDILHVFKIDLNTNKVKYEVEMQSGKKKKEVTFSYDGAIIK